jgi:vancomycin resistance protein VanJ
MAASKRAGSTPGFWFCPSCATPNPEASYVQTCLGCGAARSHPARTAGDPSPRAKRGVWVVWLVWAYAALMLLVLAGMRIVGERWWGGVLLLFFYRSLYLVPLIPLTGLAVWARRPGLLAVLAATSLLIAGPVMGLSCPIGPLLHPPRSGRLLRVMTLNRGGVLDYDTLNQFIQGEQLDVLCFQEFTRYNGEYVRRLAPGFHWSADRRIASRYPILDDEVLTMPPPVAGFERPSLTVVTVQLPSGAPVRVASVDLPSMTVPLSEVRRGRLRPSLIQAHSDWRRACVRAVVDQLAGLGPLIVAGDCNSPPDSDVLDPFRESFRNAFEQAGWGYGYSFSTARRVFRLDHIWATPGWAFTRCRVGPRVGSDHFPVWAEVVLVEPPAS